MKAVILYDKTPLAENACTALRRVGSRSNVRVRWAIYMRPIAALRDATAAEEARAEAAGAHLLVLAGPPEILPAWLSDWLERWAATRQVKDAALAVIDADGLSSAAARLSYFARQHGLSLITNEGNAVNNTTRLDLTYVREPKLSLPMIPSPFRPLVTSRAYPVWGLNE